PDLSVGGRLFLISGLICRTDFGIGIGVAAAPTARPLPVAHRIDGDAIDPAGKGAAAIKAGNGLANLDADLLSDVLGVVPMATPTPCRAVYSVVMLFDERGKGIRIAIARTHDQGLRQGGAQVWRGCGGQSHYLSMHALALLAILERKTPPACAS